MNRHVKFWILACAVGAVTGCANALPQASPVTRVAMLQTTNRFMKTPSQALHGAAGGIILKALSEARSGLPECRPGGVNVHRAPQARESTEVLCVDARGSVH